MPRVVFFYSSKIQTRFFWNLFVKFFKFKHCRGVLQIVKFSNSFWQKKIAFDDSNFLPYQNLPKQKNTTQFLDDTSSCDANICFWLPQFHGLKSQPHFSRGSIDYIPFQSLAILYLSPPFPFTLTNFLVKLGVSLETLIC